MFAVITVNGIFKEDNELVSDKDNILGFSRTFVLKKFVEGLVSALDVTTKKNCINYIIILSACRACSETVMNFAL